MILHYEYRTYAFEVFETVRKVLIVGIPATFPERGGTAQLFWGLLVASLSGTFLALYSPYAHPRNNMLAQLTLFKSTQTTLKQFSNT